MFVIKHMVPLSMVVSWIYTVAITVQSIVYEKERRLKEFMKMMGLSNIVHWIAWFITNLCTISITVALLTVILKVRSACLSFYVINQSTDRSTDQLIYTNEPTNQRTNQTNQPTNPPTNQPTN